MIAKWDKCAKVVGRKLAVFAAVALTIPALGADWTYDPDAKTISDGVWTFKATVSGNDLTVGQCTGYPGTRSTLDLSKAVSDGNGNDYTIKTLGTMFGKTSDGTWRHDTITADAAPALGEVILPPQGLTSIGDGAFGGCSSLTNVVNFLPDSVTSLGQGIFYRVPVRCDLYAFGVTGSSFGRCSFTESGVTSVHFGSGIKTIGNATNKQGAFQGCSHITNIVFHPEGSGINITKCSFAVSSSSPALKAPLVLHGVTIIGDSAFGSVKVRSITFDKGISSIHSTDVFLKNSSLSEVHFLGAPPTSWSADYNLPNQTITTYVRRKYANDWLPYAANGEINMKDSTFAAEYVTNTSKRKLLFIDKLPGFMVIVY